MTDDLMKSSGSGDADNSTHADEQRLYPKVRFRGFDEPWKKVKARQLFISKSKKNYPALPVLSASQELGMIYRSNLDSDIKTERSGLKNYKLIEPGDFVIHLRSFQGGFAYSDKRGIASPAYTVFTFKDKTNHDDYFWKEKFQTYNFIQLLKQVTYGIRDGKSISYSDFSTLKLTYTSKKEQVQISKCLKQINSLLSLQQRKLELEKALEKSLFQNLYTDFPNIFPKLAFEKSPWHAIKLQDAFTEISKRSKAGQLLTVSISKGIFPFNESERKNNSSSDKSKYKVVKINDIAYNTMRMWQGAEAVSRYDGIVSPAYTVIRAKKNQNPFFYAFMFKREKYLYLFQTYSQGLTSDTWNLKYPLFKEIKAMIPENLYIQDKIANILNTRLKHTELENTKLETFQALKQFLLQNLFI
ncbi:restriction endonuclease subunit S [Lactobacillus mulieris]|uniref:restriction endonuclease subunit S n=1 Tax=Lactobacillus mulieris TaxID=2508708 RepID=UPI0022AC0544|nr:restriction endonuclease subunit S [Lactobacillus mulieris]MCZ3623071.1 restriction endonuclease subunit S [Lactobacillus mulieris]